MKEKEHNIYRRKLNCTWNKNARSRKNLKRELKSLQLIYRDNEDNLYTWVKDKMPLKEVKFRGT